MLALVIAGQPVASAERQETWLPWEPLKDGAQNRISLRGNDPGDKLNSDHYQVRNGYARTVDLVLEITDHRGDAPARPDSPRRLVRFLLAPGQVGGFRTAPSVSIRVVKLKFRAAR